MIRKNNKKLYESIMRDVAKTVKRHLNENESTDYNSRIQSILSQLNIPVNNEGKTFIIGDLNKTIDNLEIFIDPDLYDQGDFNKRITEIQNQYPIINGDGYDHLCMTINWDEMSFREKSEIGINIDGSDMELLLKDFKKYLRQNKFKPYYIAIDPDAMCWIGIKFGKKDNIMNGLNNFITLLQYYVQFLNDNFSEYFELFSGEDSVKEFFIDQTNEALDAWSEYGRNLVKKLLKTKELSLKMDFYDAWDVVEPYFWEFLSDYIGLSEEWLDARDDLGFTNAEIDGIDDAMSTKTDVLLDYGFKDEDWDD